MAKTTTRSNSADVQLLAVPADGGAHLRKKPRSVTDDMDLIGDDEIVSTASTNGAGVSDDEDISKPLLAALSKDQKDAARLLVADEARWLVSQYYAVQDFRIQANNQISAVSRAAAEVAPSVVGEDINADPVADKTTDQVKPNAVIQQIFKDFSNVEKRLKTVLDVYTSSVKVGEWCKANYGIGPVIAAGMIANIDIKKAPTAGRIWRFAGLDPTIDWIGAEGARKLVQEAVQEFNAREKAPGEPEELTPLAAVYILAEKTNRNPENLLLSATDEATGAVNWQSLTSTLAKRPWNAKLKVLCWKLGESFVKFSGKEQCYYGQKYLQRKAYEQAKNDRFEYADQARDIPSRKRIGKDTDAHKHYSAGKLPPAHIHSRAKRWAVKIFISHLHTVWHFIEFGTLPPNPFVIEHLGHNDYFAPPHMDVVPGLREALIERGLLRE